MKAAFLGYKLTTIDPIIIILLAGKRNLLVKENVRKSVLKLK